MKKHAVEILTFCILAITLQLGYDTWKEYKRVELIRKVSAATGRITVQSADSLYFVIASCFITELEGKSFIVTNAHLFFDDTICIKNPIITVRFEGGKKFSCVLEKIDQRNDLASVVPRDADTELPAPLPLGNSDEIGLLDRVMTVGMQYGIPWVASEGLIEKQSTSRWLFPSNFLPKEFSSPHYILSSLPICPGSSGSPLIDRSGTVVGINQGYIEATRTILSIPSNDMITCFTSLRLKDASNDKK
ncbi:MAG: serine protease [Patescibacteria group bacterium]